MDTYRKFRIFPYFKNSLEDAFFYVNEISNDKNHPEYENLQFDIKNLNPPEVETYILEKEYLHLIDDNQDQYLQMCLLFIIENIQHGVAKEKLIEIQKTDIISAPYNSINLSELKLDSHNLVSIKNFSFIPNGFRYKDYIYHLVPMINGSNSSYWISQTIIKYFHTEKLDFKIRLDPFVEVLHSEYSCIEYKMQVYGKSLNWDRLKFLRDDEHGQWMNEYLSNNNITDYVWKPTPTEVHFTCEELPSISEINYRGSRYFHAIFDKNTGLIKHCDGAIRLYSNKELEYRLKFHVRNSEVRKIGKRVKIFQLDEYIEQKTFIDLITSYMVWNNDLIRYFNNN